MVTVHSIRGREPKGTGALVGGTWSSTGSRRAVARAATSVSTEHRAGYLAIAFWLTVKFVKVRVVP
jgi:hypothetical protein